MSNIKYVKGDLFEVAPEDAILAHACNAQGVWGKVEGEPLNPGLYFYNPVSSSIMELSVKEEKIEGETECFTNDTQKVNVAFTITYFPEPNQINNLYSQFGESWADKIIGQAVLGSIKDAVGKYKADDLVGNREGVKTHAEKEIQEALKQRGVVVTRLDLTNLNFDDGYEKAVEAKVTAVQRAAEAKNKTVQVEEQAKQTLIEAKANAESMRIRSEALKQNKSLVEYEAVQRWNGELPKIIMGGGSIPFIDLKGLANDSK